jgi:hypothetical protein
MSEFPGRFFSDLFSYLVFLGSFYIVFSTNFYFRYFLIPLTFYAFFHMVSNRFMDGFNYAKRELYSSEKDNIVSGEVSDKDEDKSSP